MQDNRKLAIVCQPWDVVAPESGYSIPVITHQLARRLARQWHVTIYGRRAATQPSRETDGTKVEFRRFTVHRKHQMLLEALAGVLASITGRCLGIYFWYLYHLSYALRVAFSIRASKYDTVLVINFAQFARIIKFFNPSAIVCLYMQCEWLSDFDPGDNGRRLDKIDLIIGCSGYITELIKTRFPKIAGRCHTLYNGVDTAIFCPAQDAPVRRNAVQRLLYIGRVSPEKGVHVLIRAFQILAESRPSLRLDIVGSASAISYLQLGPHREDWAIAALRRFFGDGLLHMLRRQLIGGNGCYLDDLVELAADDERIVFHAGMLQTEAVDTYQGATVLVFPSVWNEPFGLPTVEAMACGLPVVSTYSGGLPEIVEHGRTGILVPRGDARELARAIGQIIDDPGLARAMGEAGRQRAVERFSWDVASRRLADLIKIASSMQAVKAERKGKRSPSAPA